MADYPSTDDSLFAGWSISTKAFNRAHPFHRIHSPSYDKAVDPDVGGKQQAAPDGNGYNCGCRSPTDSDDFHGLLFSQLADIIAQWGEKALEGIPVFAQIIQILQSVPGGTQLHNQLQQFLQNALSSLLGIPLRALDGLLFDRLMRSVPSWVPVGRKKWDPSFAEVTTEAEGWLWHSFSNAIDMPAWQWHRFYDWNFHLRPITGWRHLMGAGNKFFDQHVFDGRFTADSVDSPGARTILQCRWDSGALGERLGAPPGFMVHATRNVFDEKFDNWMWPMPGQHVWLAGRHVYNCEHARSNDKSDVGQHRTELHPCKAIATARFEAEKFDENAQHTPAIQFMFFTSKKGGYFDFDDITDAPNGVYEFIVDLPPASVDAFRYPVGHTDPDADRNFPFNTLVIRPKLLTKLKYEPFLHVQSQPLPPGDPAEPIVELLPPKRAGVAPNQAKITIPVGKLDKSRDSFGVIIALGWQDTGGVQAQLVKKVRVDFTSVVRSSSSVSGPWRLTVGVNGRWFPINFKADADATVNLTQSVELFVAENDPIDIAACGFVREALGHYLENNPQSDREVHDWTFNNIPIPLPNVPNLPLPQKGSRVLDWKKDVDQADADTASNTARSLFMTVMFPRFDPGQTLPFVPWGEMNDQAGIVPAGRSFDALADLRNPAAVSPDLKTSFTVKDVKGGVLEGRISALHYDQWQGDEAQLDTPDAEAGTSDINTKIDYQLHLKVTVSDNAP